MKDTVLGLIRHLLTFGGGFLASSNIVAASDVDTITGAVVALVGVGFSIADKKKRR